MAKRRMSELLQARVLPSELQEFRRAAETAGFGLSAWVRETLRAAAAQQQFDIEQQPQHEAA